MKKPSHLLVYSLIFCVAVVRAETVFAGQARGSLTGRVGDQSGGSIANATVTVTQEDRTIKTTLTKNDGTYDVVDLASTRNPVLFEPNHTALNDTLLFEI